ncbi:DUF2147 domain-containing protein [Noviherbaspirillum denitrificans]|uniref:DUF2147 domain-containing protein n=1 Tax=Noviherbaspirillum denitrificans TaxID=1968433 RepID=A0A254TFH3_9BURK|nr:DUF2147 domain-containing protein [Noviherbaspirillum denitrificans]OWW19313.1 hypothetical protein AYR66_07170 [Noviherbaspirillum denitrificans]
MRRLAILTLAAGTLAAASAMAQDASPIGVWKTIDDETGKPKSLVRITESNGELRGKIEKLFRESGEDPNPKCEKCEGTLKDQPVIGMTIITGMKKDGGEYNGGQILDPNNGKVYKSKMTVVDGGKKLDVRGYIGVPMLGRTQTWVRQE